ncbi:hypothetical protein Q2319_26675, partial [Escherichia coli]|nr:hypothetical protein [Escherichia coli]
LESKQSFEIPLQNPSTQLQQNDFMALSLHLISSLVTQLKGSFATPPSRWSAPRPLPCGKAGSWLS